MLTLTVLDFISVVTCSCNCYSHLICALLSLLLNSNLTVLEFELRVLLSNLVSYLTLSL